MVSRRIDLNVSQKCEEIELNERSLESGRFEQKVNYSMQIKIDLGGVLRQTEETIRARNELYFYTYPRIVC